MGTHSRIGYLEDGKVTSIFCNSDGYIAFNGVLLHEHYKDIEKIKELVSRGNAAHLGTKVFNTLFYKDEDEHAIVETLDEYISHASYHYLFDVNDNQWRVYNDRKVALLSNVINNLSSFSRIEGYHFKDTQEAFKGCADNKEAFVCGWQSWWSQQTKLIESIIDQDSMCVDVYYWDYQKDSDGNLLKDAVHLYIPFKTLSEADELSEIVYGKSIEEIKQEFGSYLTQPGLDEKIDSAEKVAELNDKGKEQTQLRSYIYKGEF